MRVTEFNSNERTNKKILLLPESKSNPEDITQLCKSHRSNINTLIIPAVMYSFNIINWTRPKIRRLDTEIRKLLTCNRMDHPKADVDRLYIPRNGEGRGMIQLELSCKTSTIGRHKYLTTTTHWMLQLILAHDKTKNSLYK